MSEPAVAWPKIDPILDSIATAIVVLDEALRIRYLNSAAEQLLSISGRQATGTGLGDVLRLEPALGERLHEVRRLAHPCTGRETRLTLVNGEQLLVDYTASPLYVGSQVQAVVLEMNRQDRHHRIAREEALLAQQEASRALARGLAHEVKNPLGGLRGAAQLLERQLNDSDQREYTHIIIREADRLQNLLNRMLGPNSRPQLEAVNVHEITEHVRKLLQAEADDSVQVLTNYDPSIPRLRLDRDWLVQALLNIARNSLQVLPGGGRIELRTRVLRKYTIGAVLHRLVVQIQVIDDGPGIAQDIQEKIFYPLVTGRSHGTGLGLSIAQSLVSALGGLIECTSQPGRTVFDVLLPLESEDE